MSETVATRNGGEVRFRQPDVRDGAAIHQAVVAVGTLDRNSTYLYLLLCRDFADTCILAERGGRLAGFITGYRPPAQNDTIFVWQVGVLPEARGAGVANRMLDNLLLSEGCRGVRVMETTVTPSNTASRAMFESLARRLGAKVEETEGFPAEMFSESGHEPEGRLRIGPFDVKKLQGAG